MNRVATLVYLVGTATIAFGITTINPAIPPSTLKSIEDTSPPNQHTTSTQAVTLETTTLQIASIDDIPKSRRKPSLDTDNVDQNDDLNRQAVGEHKEEKELDVEPDKVAKTTSSVHPRKGAPKKVPHGKKELRSHGKKELRIDEETVQDGNTAEVSVGANVTTNKITINKKGDKGTSGHENTEHKDTLKTELSNAKNSSQNVNIDSKTLPPPTLPPKVKTPITPRQPDASFVGVKIHCLGGDCSGKKKIPAATTTRNPLAASDSNSRTSKSGQGLSVDVPKVSFLPGPSSTSSVSIATTTPAMTKLNAQLPDPAYGGSTGVAVGLFFALVLTAVLLFVGFKRLDAVRRRREYRRMNDFLIDGMYNDA